MLPLRSYWPVLLPLALEACHLHLRVDLASLERCSCLCSESIPSVTEQSVMFVKELSFPQTTPTDDALFSTGTGLERVGVAGLDQDR